MQDNHLAGVGEIAFENAFKLVGITAMDKSFACERFGFEETLVGSRFPFLWHYDVIDMHIVSCSPPLRGSTRMPGPFARPVFDRRWTTPSGSHPRPFRPVRPRAAYP